MEPTPAPASPTDTFAIEILSTDPPAAMPDAQGGTGRITIGDFSEGFFASLTYWDIDEYERSWAASVRHALASEEADSVLITSITEPSTSNFVFSWPLHRRGDVVYVQNAIIFLDELSTPFDPRQPWLSVNPRETVTEDGDHISEWRTSADALRTFLGTAASR